MACVRQEVVATLGQYQEGDTGPFPAWATLQEATTAASGRRGFEVDTPEFVTGALSGAVSTAVTPDGQAAVGVADGMVGSGAPGDEVRNIGDVAVAQELGTDTLPRRSFLGIGAYRAAGRAVAAFVLPVLGAVAGISPRDQSSGARVRHMAMIEAYRIGVELVLGGDLATGLDALVPGLERLDARITHANAAAAEQAARLGEVAEAAPEIGRAADQMARLSAAMVSVNQAVEAWRPHGGVPPVGVPGLSWGGGGSVIPAAGRRGMGPGCRDHAPGVVMDAGFGDGQVQAGSRRRVRRAWWGVALKVPTAPREDDRTGPCVDADGEAKARVRGDDAGLAGKRARHA